MNKICDTSHTIYIKQCIVIDEESIICTPQMQHKHIKLCIFYQEFLFDFNETNATIFGSRILIVTGSVKI